MITASEAFKKAIKSDMREVVAKVKFNYSTPLVLLKDMIQSIDIISSGDTELGTIQTDAYTIKLMKNSFTDAQFNANVDVEVSIGCLVGVVYEYINVGTYTADGWLKDDATGIVTVRLTNKINLNAIMSENVISSNCSLKDYIKKSVQLISGYTVSIGSVLDSALESAYLYSEDFNVQLKAFAQACNGLFRYISCLELVPYKHSPTSETLKQGSNESIITVSRVSDYSKIAKIVTILKTFFSKSSVSSIFSSGNITLKPGETNHAVLMDVGSPCAIKYFALRPYGYVGSYKTGINKTTIYLNNGYGDRNVTVNLDVFGRKIVSTTIGEKTVTDGTVTYIENPYIQNDAQIAGLSKKIYEGVSYRIKYRGNPQYQVGDTVKIEGYGYLLITKHQLNFNGGLIGNIEGVLVSEL